MDENGRNSVRQKVVVHLKGGVIVKGYTQTEAPSDLTSLLENPYRSFPSELKLTSENGDSLRAVNLADAKAVYYVKTFEGNKETKGVRFYENGPTVQGIWVEIRFKDGEVVEGIIHNSVHHLVEPGFFLSPSDPLSNNELMYVLKTSVADYRVLGIRTL